MELKPKRHILKLEVLKFSIWKPNESKGKPDRKEVDNVLKKPIQEKIEKYNTRRKKKAVNSKAYFL